MPFYNAPFLPNPPLRGSCNSFGSKGLSRDTGAPLPDAREGVRILRFHESRIHPGKNMPT